MKPLIAAAVTAAVLAGGTVSAPPVEGDNFPKWFCKIFRVCPWK